MQPCLYNSLGLGLEGDDEKAAQITAVHSSETDCYYFVSSPWVTAKTANCTGDVSGFLRGVEVGETSGVFWWVGISHPAAELGRRAVLK